MNRGVVNGQLCGDPRGYERGQRGLDVGAASASTTHHEISASAPAFSGGSM